jgi:hypothetical protein
MNEFGIRFDRSIGAFSRSQDEPFSSSTDMA